MSQQAWDDAVDGAGPVEAVEAGAPAPDDKQSTRLIALARGKYRLGRTDAGEPFAEPHEGPRIARMLRGGHDSLRAELARLYFTTYRSAANASALADAVLVLEGFAGEAEPEPVYLRLARHGGGIVLDLGDATGRVVLVDPSGWRIEARSPVMFRRSELSGALPEPTRGGNLDDLRQLLNVTAATWPLALGWIVAAFIYDIPHPIALMGGEMGSGKSTGAEFLAGLVDPSPVPLRTPPMDVEGWAVAASGSWIVPVDNVSTIAPWWSDALCRSVTGDGMVRRKLYSDNGLSVLSFRRVVALTSIDPGALRGDLGDRLLLIDLERIDPTHRREDADLRAEYKRLRPSILGALLDLLAGALREWPTIRLAERSRMADFDRVLAAVDRVLGTDGLARYRDQAGRVAEEVVESDPVAGALRLLAEGGGFTGTAAELLARLTTDRPPKGWPPNARAMSGAVRRARPALRQIGVEIRDWREPGGNRRRLFEVSTRSGPAATVPTVPTVPNAANPGGNGGTVPGRSGPPDVLAALHRPDASVVWDESWGLRDGRDGRDDGPGPHSA